MTQKAKFNLVRFGEMTVIAGNDPFMLQLCNYIRRGRPSSLLYALTQRYKSRSEGVREDENGFLYQPIMMLDQKLRCVCCKEMEYPNPSGEGDITILDQKKI